MPAYNEAGTIGSVVDGALEHVDEVVVVDDGSSDGTPEIARRHGATVVRHAINTGVGGAARTGYRYAFRNDYDLVLQIDSDGQHDPAYIPDLLEAIEDADVVIGSRYRNQSYKEYSAVRNSGIRFFTWLVNVLGGVEITDVTSGYRLYRADALREIVHQSDMHWAVEQTMAAGKRDLRIEEVSIEMPIREEGQSQFDLETFVMYPARMFDAILRVLIFR